MREAKIGAARRKGARGKFRGSRWLIPAAVAMLSVVLNSWTATAIAQTKQPAPIPTCGATEVTLANQNSYPIWIGEGIESGGIFTPPGNNWEINSGGSFSLCLPASWTSGTFWARTECDFTDLYQSGPASGNSRPGAFTTCGTSSDCATLATNTDETYDCFGGVCMVDCSTGPNNTNAYCQSQIGIPGDTNATCSSNTGAAGVSVCTYPEGVVCRTGDCQGQWECQGTWGSLSADTGPETPASQFEITDNSVADGGQGAATYDVTNVAGYNQPINVSLDTPSNPGQGPTCLPNSCTTDLNSVCPALLQIIEPPTGNSGSCGTNNATCQSGVCEPCPSGAEMAACNGGSTCVIGCSGPGQLCGKSYPSPISAPGVAGLECSTTVPSGSVHGIPFTMDGSQYTDMYNAVNNSGAVSASHIGVTMFSSNQGTPTCWGDIDCAPGEECLIGPAGGVTGLPSYVGFCATPPSGQGLPTVQQVTNCTTTTDIGMNCGGYPNSPVYTCVASSAVASGVACLPLGPNATTSPAVTVGLGPYDTTSQFFEGVGGPINPEWEAASLWAAGNGSTAGSTPYYETFSEACPHQYAWTYDDHTGGLACNGYPLAFTVAFGQLSGSATPTATPTPTSTATATATASASATATATSSATPGATSTSTATATATQTATPTATASPTATATSTASATSTSTASSTPTATATPTSTPTPSGSPTPRCIPNVYLSTNPAGTLAFGNVKPKGSVTKSLTVTNNEPAGSLTLSAEIVNGSVNGLSVTGGSCTTSKTLKPATTANTRSN